MSDVCVVLRTLLWTCPRYSHWLTVCICVCVSAVSSCTANNVSTASAGLRQREITAGEGVKMQRGRTEDIWEREREKRWQKRKKRWRSTLMDFNGLLCIQHVAAGFWKPLHTVSISLAKRANTTAATMPRCRPHISLRETHFRDNPRMLEAFLGCREGCGRIVKKKKSIKSHLIQAGHGCFYILIFHSSH